jgi:hypothetical protein
LQWLVKAIDGRFMVLGFAYSLQKKYKYHNHTVDGRNPAPVGRW